MNRNSRPQQPYYHVPHPQAYVRQQQSQHHSSLPIIVHDHDVLSGRGVNVAHHPGNERFRTLVTTRADSNYCTHYSASEKRAVAEEIIKHIKQLNPPGRFLKKDTRVPQIKGLGGVWIELNDRECLRKTCQALRDCNRTDRQGYASGVTMPEDVLQEYNQRAQSGLSGKQQAAAAAAASATVREQVEQSEVSRSVAMAASIPATPFLPPPPHAHVAAAIAQNKKRAAEEAAIASSNTWDDDGRISPSVENAAEWLKRQRTDDAMATAAAAAAVSLTPHDEEAIQAANAVNDLLTSTTNEEDDIAEAAEVVASITDAHVSDDVLGDFATSTSQQAARHPYELSLSAPEEALAREMAASVGGFMGGASGGVNETDDLDGGVNSLLAMNTAPLESLAAEAAVLNTAPLATEAGLAGTPTTTQLGPAVGSTSPATLATPAGTTPLAAPALTGPVMNMTDAPPLAAPTGPGLTNAPSLAASTDIAAEVATGDNATITPTTLSTTGSGTLSEQQEEQHHESGGLNLHNINEL